MEQTKDCKSGTNSYKPIEINLYSVLRCIRDIRGKNWFRKQKKIYASFKEPSILYGRKD